MLNTLQAQHVATQIMLLESAAHVERAKSFLYFALVALVVWVAILLPIVLHYYLKHRRDAMGAIDEHFQRERAEISDRLNTGFRQGNNSFDFPASDDKRNN